MFTWRPEMSVGHPDIDNDHRRLVDLLNAFEGAAGREPSEAVLHDTLLQLQDYVIDHFGREEAIQRQAGYPFVVEHKREHDALVERLTEFAKTYFIARRRPVDRAALAEFAVFLREWFVVHTMGADLRMKGWVGVKPAGGPSPSPPAAPAARRGGR